MNIALVKPATRNTHTAVDLYASEAGGGTTDTGFISQIFAFGGVKALTDPSQFRKIIGREDFNDFSADAQAKNGIQFHTGALSDALPGVTVGGGFSGAPFSFGFFGSNFGTPERHGVVEGDFNAFAGAATFFGAHVTQFGLTASRNGDQYIDVFDTVGKLLGQIDFVSNGAASFVGVDTGGVDIGMVTFGNHDLLNGNFEDLGGITNISDTWIWGE
jgi:hypothetical protein